LEVSLSHWKCVAETALSVPKAMTVAACRSPATG